MGCQRLSYSLLSLPDRRGSHGSLAGLVRPLSRRAILWLGGLFKRDAFGTTGLIFRSALFPCVPPHVGKTFIVGFIDKDAASVSTGFSTFAKLR